MLLRSVLALAGLSLLSACTIPLWGENDPSKNDPDGGLKPVELQIPPDLSKPATSAQYKVARPDPDCLPPASAAVEADTSAAARDIEDRLKEIQSLRDKGLINDQELQDKRKALLDTL